MLQTEVKRIISASAPASIKGGYQVITIGDLDLIVSQISYTVSITNYTDVTETTYRPTPTMSMEMTSTPYITYCKFSDFKISGTTLKFYFNLIANKSLHRYRLILIMRNLFLQKIFLCNVRPNQATETPSVEKHAHPPRVVYCVIYLTLTLITKFRVSNLHITTR